MRAMTSPAPNEPALDLSPSPGDEVKTTTCYMCACRCGIKVWLKDDGSGEADSLDRSAADLRVRKERSGRSYADIARRIAELRIDRGVAASAAQPARSTISDAFRDGRTWVDPVLLGDIVRALGGDEDEAAAWVARSSAVRRGGRKSWTCS